MSNTEQEFRESEIGKHLTGQIHQLDEAIPLAVQKNYFRNSALIRHERFQVTSEYIAFAKEQFDRYTEIEPERLMNYLSHLAIGGNIEAMRLIESFQPQEPEVLHQWAMMALFEARIGVVTYLVDEQQIAITSGLGGRNGMMRMEALIYQHSLEPLKEYERKLIEEEFKLTIEREGGETETILFGDNYAHLRFLLPLQHKLKVLFKSFIENCNQYGGFLSSNFYVTNMAPINQEEIISVLEAYRKKEHLS